MNRAKVRNLTKQRHELASATDELQVQTSYSQAGGAFSRRAVFSLSDGECLSSRLRAKHRLDKQTNLSGIIPRPVGNKRRED